IIIHRLGPVMLDVGSLVVIDGFLAVVSNPMGLVVLDFDVLIFFGVDEELFAAFFVFETGFVEIVGAAAFAGAALDAALGFVGGETIGHGLISIIDSTRDDGPVGIAFQKLNDHFLANARDMNVAPLFSSPVLRDSDPA